jgi:hypothetical protein
MHGDMRNIHKMFVAKPEEKRLFEGYGRRCEDVWTGFD